MKKNIIIILTFLIFIILCVPVRLSYKDGGTIEYKAVLYSVTKRHSIWTNKKGTQGYLPEYGENAEGFLIGTEFRLFGFLIKDNVQFVENEK